MTIKRYHIEGSDARHVQSPEGGWVSFPQLEKEANKQLANIQKLRNIPLPNGVDHAPLLTAFHELQKFFEQFETFQPESVFIEFSTGKIFEQPGAGRVEYVKKPTPVYVGIDPGHECDKSGKIPGRVETKNATFYVDVVPGPVLDKAVKDAIAISNEPRVQHVWLVQHPFGAIKGIYRKKEDAEKASYEAATKCGIHYRIAKVELK